MPIQVFKKGSRDHNMPARTGRYDTHLYHTLFAERLISGFCIVATSETGEPMLAAVQLYITQDDYMSLPNDTHFVWFTKFTAWATDPDKGNQGIPLARLQRGFYSRLFAINGAIAHRCLHSITRTTHFCRFFGTDKFGVVEGHAYLRFDTHTLPLNSCS